jgi:hypothetical protein
LEKIIYAINKQTKNKIINKKMCYWIIEKLISEEVKVKKLRYKL